MLPAAVQPGDRLLLNNLNIADPKISGYPLSIAPGLYSYFGLLEYSLFIATISREAYTVNMCGWVIAGLIAAQYSHPWASGHLAHMLAIARFIAT
jgi:hypothetical protein